MRGTTRITVAALGCVLLARTARLDAQDWPQWRGPDRDGRATGFVVPQNWPDALPRKWQAQVGTGCAAPALVGDRLYVFSRQGGEETVSCLNAGDGTQVWQDKYAAQEVTGPAGRHPGPRGSPAVADGKVVTFGVGGVVSCLDGETGSVLWRKDPFPKAVPRFFTSMSPLIVDGMAIAHVGAADNGALIAFDLNSGDEKWRWAEEGPEYASPVLLTVADTKQIVTMTAQSIVGIGAADGKLLWQLPFPPARRSYNAATPIVQGATVIYAGAGRGTKAVKIEKQDAGFTVTELWSNPDLAPQYNTPVLKDGLLFGLSARGNLFCLDAQTGQTAWTDETRHGRGFAAIVAAGPVMLALPSTSELIAYKADAAAYAELAGIKVADTETYAHLVIAGTRLFVKDQETVAMLTIE